MGLQRGSSVEIIKIDDIVNRDRDKDIDKDTDINKYKHLAAIYIEVGDDGVYRVRCIKCKQEVKEVKTNQVIGLFKAMTTLFK